MHGLERVLRYFEALGFRDLTEIQRLAVPKVYLGEADLLISAPTGSGKTEAVVLPLLVKLVERREVNYGVRVLYITPLRALNRDLSRRLERICNLLGCAVEVWHGDTPYSRRRKIISQPPTILITTPESLQILLINEGLRPQLNHLYAVVADELQDIMSSERGVQLVLALERLDRHLGRHARRIGISSVLNERDLYKIGSFFFCGRAFDAAFTRGLKKYEVETVLAGENYEGGAFRLEEVVKTIAEIVISERHRQQLLFTNTRASAEELAYALSTRTAVSVPIGVHHGSLSRDVREALELKFRGGDVKVVVATSSLELGIDVGTVDLVLQYMSPRQALRLIQRVGRAGHKEGATSRGVIVVPPLITEVVESLVIARRTIHGNLEPLATHTNAIDVLAHQIVGMAIESGAVNADTVWDLISRAPLYSQISREKVYEIIKFLEEVGLLRCNEDACRATRRGVIYYRTTNTIPEGNQYEMRSMIDHKGIALLDEDFALSCTEGELIIVGGKVWKVLGVDDDKRIVWVAPPENLGTATLPRWAGDNIPVHRGVAREVCAFIRRLCTCNSDSCLKSLKADYGVSDELFEFLLRNREDLCRLYPRDDRLVIELYPIADEGKTIVCFYHCLGSRGSEAFSLLLLHALRNLLGAPVSYRSHQIASAFLVGSKVEALEVIAAIKKMVELWHAKALEKVVETEVKATPRFRKRLVEVAKKMGIVDKRAKVEEIRRALRGLEQVALVTEEALRELFTEELDVEPVKQMIERLASRKLKVLVKKVRRPTPYLQEITYLSALRSLVKSASLPKTLLIELAKRRLLDRGVTLLCTQCATLFKVELLGMVKEKCANPFRCKVLCPHCGALAVMPIDNDEEKAHVLPLIRKIKDGLTLERLEPEERKRLERVSKKINLLMEYGLAALIALQGVGVGVETAKKVLAKAHDLDSLVEHILEQEKLFLRTRGYWD